MIRVTIVLFALLPAYLLKAEILGIPTTILEMATYAVAVAFLVNIFLDKSLRERVKGKILWLYRRQRPFLIVLGIFLLAAILATIFTVDLRRSAGVLKGWFFDPLLAASILFFVLENKRQLYQLAIALSVMAAALSWYGLLDFYVPVVGVYNDYLARLDSIFQSANYHTMLTGPIIILGLALWLFDSDFRRSRLFTLLTIGTLVINLWAFYLTYSYGGYLGLSFGLVVILLALYWQRSHRRKLFKTFSAAFLLILTFTIIAIFSSSKFERDFLNLRGVSAVRGRVEIWRTSAALVKESPIVGLGLGNFDEGYVRKAEQVLHRKPLEAVVIHAHNLFLNFWIEAGLLGLLAILSLFVTAAILVKRTFRGELGLVIGAGGALAVIFGHGLIDTPYFKNDLSYLFWLLFAILLLINYWQNKQNRELGMKN